MQLIRPDEAESAGTQAAERAEEECAVGVVAVGIGAGGAAGRLFV